MFLVTVVAMFFVIVMGMLLVTVVAMCFVVMIVMIAMRLIAVVAMCLVVMAFPGTPFAVRQEGQALRLAQRDDLCVFGERGDRPDEKALEPLADPEHHRRLFEQASIGRL